MTTKDNQYASHPSKTDLEAVRAQAVSLIQSLDFLISLSDEDYQALSKPSPARVEGAIALFSVVRNNPGLFPAAIIDLAEGERDAHTRATVLELRDGFTPAVARLNDTLNALNSDLYRMGLNIYNIANRYKDRLSHDDRALVDQFAKLNGKRI